MHGRDDLCMDIASTRYVNASTANDKMRSILFLELFHTAVKYCHSIAIAKTSARLSVDCVRCVSLLKFRQPCISSNATQGIPVGVVRRRPPVDASRVTSARTAQAIPVLHYRAVSQATPLLALTHFFMSGISPFHNYSGNQSSHMSMVKVAATAS
jgi:hypothetical protein